MPICWPDSARICAQPALRKSSAIEPSRSSRTPTISASSNGPATPPARLSEASKADLMDQRIRSRADAGARIATSPPSTKAAGTARASGHAPAPPRAGVAGLRNPTDTICPRISVAGPPPRTYTSRGPLAVTRAPSRPRAASSSIPTAVMPEAVRLGSAVIMPSQASTPVVMTNPGDALPAQVSTRA